MSKLSIVNRTILWTPEFFGLSLLVGIINFSIFIFGRLRGLLERIEQVTWRKKSHLTQRSQRSRLLLCLVLRAIEIIYVVFPSGVPVVVG